jgi:hypothetical protein
MSKSRVDLVQDALKICSEQHSHIFARFTAVDTKAQGLATAGGALVAATLGFIAQAAFASLKVRVGFLATIAAATVLTLATAAVALSLMALEVRPARAAFRGDIVAETVLDLLTPQNREAAGNEEIIEAVYAQQLSQWPLILRELAVVLNSKARRVLAAQAFFSAAALAIAVFAGIVLFT